MKLGRPLLVTVFVLAFASIVLPAIEVPGGPRRWIDPGWVEGLSTFWAFMGAAVILWIEIGRDRRQEVLDIERLYADFAGAFAVTESIDEHLANVFVHNFGRYPVSRILVQTWIGKPEIGKNWFIIDGPILPGQRAQALIDGPSGNNSVWPGVNMDLYFAGANGKYYLRDPEGIVQEIGTERYASVALH